MSSFSQDQTQSELVEIFKTEYSNLIAVLSHYYHVSDLQLAEDIVSETFVRAMKAWSHKGVPQYPNAWLRKVAQNLYYEHLRKQKTFEEKVAPAYGGEVIIPASLEITEEVIADSQLRMIFVICDPALNTSSQLCSALRILCGFTTEEIANALISNKESVNKKLYRAKMELRDLLSPDKELSKEDYQDRLDNVLRVIYLIFNEGYYSTTSEVNIRHDFCWEAMRLAIFLTKQSLFDLSPVYALLAIMCFHGSRIAARDEGESGAVLYDEQDRSKWNFELIAKGQQYLKRASASEKVSKYHIEAAIAYWHTGDHPDKWDQILMLYNKLLTIEYSPVIAMNRTYALAKAQSPKKAIQEALKLDLHTNAHYHCLLAELYKMNHEQDNEINSLT
ncbi:MAG: sigma-70 family RNA polymerase sigma factor, partial [Opitutae bacterium]